MRLHFLTAAIVIAMSTVPAGLVRAHHSVAGEFDGSRPVVLQGVITQVKWGSPHVWVFMDVRDPSGRTVNWGVECAPPSRMPGIARSALKVGDTVTINAYRARDSSRNDAHAYDVILADGRRLVIGLRLS
jgi:hypothetical protein